MGGGEKGGWNKQQAACVVCVCVQANVNAIMICMFSGGIIATGQLATFLSLCPAPSRSRDCAHAKWGTQGWGRRLP